MTNKDSNEKRLKINEMTSAQRKLLILKKMKEKGIEIGSGVSGKSYDKDEVRDLIKIANCFPELRSNNN